MSHYRKKNPPTMRQLDEEELKQLEYYAGLKFTVKQISKLFKAKSGKNPNRPMGEHQLDEIIQHQDAAHYAWHQGKIRASLIIRSNLFKLAQGIEKKDGKGWVERPSERAIEMWGTYHDNWAKKDTLEITGADGGPIETKDTTLSIEDRLSILKKLKEALSE